ncbi:MAG: tRNA pseudouridine(55) synthase TruB [Bacteroidetes bacterium]|nr:tRNA pseudouridine(55) synthase TruB [Bacteroidota bacterium]
MNKLADIQTQPLNYELTHSLAEYEAGKVLLIDKPYGWTSFQAVNKIKYAIKHQFKKIIKIGHAGTLDPLATGLLIVCTGKATKTIDQIQALPKEYTGTFFLGATTPCFDLEKEVDATYPTEHITNKLIYQAAKDFEGDIMQTPPVFSAVKINGKRAYDYARAGQEVEIKAKPITIYSFEVTKIEMPLLHFKIKCSKGTYIRSIARDFGLALNSGAHLTSLRRTMIGEYNLSNVTNIKVDI